MDQTNREVVYVGYSFQYASRPFGTACDKEYPSRTFYPHTIFSSSLPPPNTQYASMYGLSGKAPTLHSWKSPAYASSRLGQLRI